MKRKWVLAVSIIFAGLLGGRVAVWLMARSFDVAERKSTWLIETIRWNETAAASALIYFGADILAKDEDGKSAVYHAAWGRHRRMAGLLLERGASRVDFRRGQADRRRYDKEQGVFP